MRLHCKFYYSLTVLNGNSEGEWFYLIANIIKFYEGGIGYSDIMSMGFKEILKWHSMARKINHEIKSESRKR